MSFRAESLAQQQLKYSIKSTWRAFPEDAVIYSITHIVCMLFMTAFCQGALLYSHHLSFLSSVPALSISLPISSLCPGLFSFPVSPPHGLSVCIWQADAHHANAPFYLFFKSLHALSKAKQISRNSALSSSHILQHLCSFLLCISVFVNILYINLSGRLISFTLWNVQLYSMCCCKVFHNDEADLKLFYTNFNRLLKKHVPQGDGKFIEMKIL